jgi:hypothetical protein
MRSCLIFALLLFTAACSSATTTDAESSDSDYTAATPDASAGDVAPFTDADKPDAYGARVRVSYAGGPASEAESTGSYGAASRMPWAMGVGVDPAQRDVFLYFGASDAKTFDVGTYSCADGDAMIFEAQWDAQGNALPSRGARECSVVVDRIVAGPSARYARAYGRFTASAAAPDGLSTDLKGAFLADFPIGE